MRSIRQSSFPFKTGKDYPFFKVDFNYNFSKVQKIINLETYLFLAVDQQFNLHFIQYRDPYPHEKTIVPPSFAIKGTGHFKFSLEYHTLRAFLYNKNIEDVGCSWCFKDRLTSKETSGKHSYDNWPDIFYIGQDQLLMKLSSEEPAFILYYDHRLESEERNSITWLKKGTYITPVDSYRAILYKRSKSLVVLTCALSQKVKILNFTHSKGLSDIRVLSKEDIAIGISTGTYPNTIEIIDLIKNKVIEKIILFASKKQKVIIDEVDHSGKFIIYYTKTTGKANMVMLTVWRTLPDRTVRSSEEIRLSHPINPNVIEFLNKDHIVVLNNDHTIGIYRLDDEGILKIHQSTAALDPEYLPKAKPPKSDEIYSYSCLKVLDEKTFVAVFARTDDVNTDRQRVIVFNYAFESDSENEAQASEYAGPTRFKQITTKVLISHAPDKVSSITHWEDKFVVFLTRSNKLYHYDLELGKLSLIVTLKGIDPDESSVVNMEVLEGKYVGIVFKGEARRDWILVFDILERKVHFDDEITTEKYCLSRGRIFVMCPKSYTEAQYCFGEFDLVQKEIKFLSNYTERSLLSNLIVTPKLIAIGTSIFQNVINNLELEKVVFYSLEEKRVLYEINVDELASGREPQNRVKRILCIEDNLIALLVDYLKYDNYYGEIVLWDIEKKCRVASYYEECLKWMLGVCKDHLLYSCTDSGTDFLNISPYLGKYEKKEESGELNWEDIWYEYGFQPLVKCMDTLLPKLPVIVAYDKKIFPNSLLFFRRKKVKAECLRILTKEIGEFYNPYVTRQVIDLIFKPQENQNLEEDAIAESGEA